MSTTTNTGTASKTKISKRHRGGGPPSFDYEVERRNVVFPFGNGWWIPSLYKKADGLEEYRIFEIADSEPEKMLEHLKKEIKVRIAITAQEIFIIGELLHQAKNICQEANISYKKWIADNFDFSYETANNFKNVYKYCFAHRKVAIKIPPSILYKLSKPNFTDELREYLLTHADLENTSNKQLKAIIEKYKEHGLEAVESEINKLSIACRIDRQTRYTFDQFENALRLIKDLLTKMESGEEGGRCLGGYKFEDMELDSRKAERVLYNALTLAYEDLDQAQTQAFKIRNAYMEQQLEHLSPTEGEESPEQEEENLAV